MPELPEVETTCRGIRSHIVQQTIEKITVRHHQLRMPVPQDISTLCQGKRILDVQRRAKYLLISLSSGFLLIHLGMSGHLRIIDNDCPASKHDHIDLHFTNGKMLRYHDPRRFGLFTYFAETPFNHPLLNALGPEPLSDEFNPDYLQQKALGKKQAIKSFIMDNHVVVGVGNIYATESLFLAHIHPSLPAGLLSVHQHQSLTAQIKSVLTQAIAAGGTTLKDFYSSSGKPGYFTANLHVYGRLNAPCKQCNTTIAAITIAGRRSAYCPWCQTL